MRRTKGGREGGPKERLNIWAMRQVGVTRLLSISAVGSLRENIVPGDLVLVDQFIDKTHKDRYWNERGHRKTSRKRTTPAA